MLIKKSLRSGGFLLYEDNLLIFLKNLEYFVRSGKNISNNFGSVIIVKILFEVV